PDVMAVSHNHSPSLIPFGITRTALRPVLHMGALAGGDVPLWDIRDDFGDTNLLVIKWEQGQSLARALGPRRVALMRGHGSVVATESLREVVMASVYLEVNAKLQLQAQSLGAEINFLTPGEIEQCADMLVKPAYPSLDRAWEYWRARAGCSGLEA
ncbi:MAG TPA: class II aldolase/adducin family protein, partial [Chloroflexota bacterium]|nr:class II aldolase/adducin family protein [Chloroflexota bacterium]